MSTGYQLQSRNTSSLTDIAQLPVKLIDTGAGGGNALIEYGENANGYYLKFIDGTQICGHRDLSPRYSGTSSISVNLTYPATFNKVFSVVSGVYTAMSQGSHCLVSTTTSSNIFSNTSVNLILLSDTGATMGSGNKSAGYISIGRWK